MQAEGHRFDPDQLHSNPGCESISGTQERESDSSDARKSGTEQEVRTLTAVIDRTIFYN